MSEVTCGDPWRRLYDGIARVLLDNRLEPTPTNYALAHRYLTAQDRAFNGSVERADVVVSSGIPLLDAAALRIARLAEPYPPLPKTAEDPDILNVVRTWRFMPGGTLVDQ